MPVARMKPWIRAFRATLLGDAPVLAAGVALFALLATIPGLAAIVAIYGLVANPADIQEHLDGLRRVLPEEVVAFLTEQLEREAGRTRSELGLALAGTLAFALYSARSTVDAMMTGLNHVYGVQESRHMLRTLAISLAVAGAALFGVFAVTAVVIALPAILALLGTDGDPTTAAALIRWPLLFAVVVGGLMAVYRHVPSPRDYDHRRFFPGAVVGTILWILVSVALSFWVHRVADFPNVYGAFASVLVLILWFYLSALTVLLGGLVNAELERAGVEREPRPPI